MSLKSLTNTMDDFLRARGFARRGRTWKRSTDSFVDVVDLQVSKSGDTVTVNAGVLDPAVSTQCWGEKPPAFVQCPHCTVRARIGTLVDGRDRWWPLGDEPVSDDVVVNVDNHVLPFLETMHSRAAMEEFLRTEVAGKRYPYPPDVICLAILKAGRGDRIGACADLGRFRERVLGGWSKRIDEVAERLESRDWSLS